MIAFQFLDSKSVKISLSVLAVISIIVGIYLMIFGWRLFKISALIVGLILGFLIGFWIIISSVPEKYNWAPWVAYAVGSVLGLILAIIMFRNPVFGIMFMGNQNFQKKKKQKLTKKIIKKKGSALGFLIGSILFTVALARTKFVYAYWICVGNFIFYIIYIFLFFILNYLYLFFILNFILL